MTHLPNHHANSAAESDVATDADEHMATVDCHPLIDGLGMVG